MTMLKKNKGYMKSAVFVLLTIWLTVIYAVVRGQTVPDQFKNPILPGFNPDPSICRVADDYYLVTSSFTWFPAIPIYHSKDLVHWELIGHGLEQSGQIDLNAVTDKNGIWAPTIRYHDGLFYIISTCNTCGGNFYITARDPRGPWSNPVWLTGAPGIDPSLFWDDDGKCYYTGNRWDIKTADKWLGQTGIWMQELDLKKQQLIGEPKLLTYGHASNAQYVEGPHLYKINDRYVLLVGEGGTDYNHAVTAHVSASLWGPYAATIVNPVLSHRQLGKNYPIQAVGHADLVQTQNGEWWSVVLGKRLVDGKVPLGRETFLCKVDFQDGTPIYNAGHGKILSLQRRPDLPWSPLSGVRKEGDPTGNSYWYTIRTAKHVFYEETKSGMILPLMPAVLDSLTHAAIVLQKVTDTGFTVSAKVDFKAKDKREQAGLVLYRTTNSYYLLCKEKDEIVLYKKFKEAKQVIARLSYRAASVYFEVDVNRLTISFRYGSNMEAMKVIGDIQDLTVLSDNEVNRFNGLGIGFYASSNGGTSNRKALFEDYTYVGKK
jgi:Beta-xylosidase